MIDFTKRIPTIHQVKKIHPIEIYDTLDRSSETGPLRPTQYNILDTWYNNRLDEKDLIIKLHTGEGKTLIGLLIALSYLNLDQGPALYICPNIHLVKQVCSEADKFGIPCCFIGNDNEIPNEFYQGKKILVTHVQKVFNGLSIFGIGNSYINVGCIILDDSHACIDSIKNSCNIRIQRDHELYKHIKMLFENDLKQQGEGSYLELDQKGSNTIIPIPYWNWNDKIEQVLYFLNQYASEKPICFAWPLIKDSLNSCQAFISNDQIEISPYYVPIQKFGTFFNAKHRILMSATTQEDTFFLKGLGLSVESVKNPLTNHNQKWSGEKMILIPSLICKTTNEDTVIRSVVQAKRKKIGEVILAPSFFKANRYKQMGAIVANIENNDIYELTDSLKKGNFENPIVLVNRYDGVDLPDNSCRILIIDSLPFCSSLADRYEELCRTNSKIMKIKTAQKIEQGLGRSVRGEKDFSVIIIVGSDLVKFIKSVNTNTYFSGQTQKQIQIGMEIAEMSAEENDGNDISLLFSLINQCLQRDEGWKTYYNSVMDEVKEEKISSKDFLYDILLKEKQAEEFFLSGDYIEANELVQQIIDSTIDPAEKGWYLQMKARCVFPLSVAQSNQLQICAFKKNPQLLKPLNGITYSKLRLSMDDTRVKRIKDQLIKKVNHEELMLDINNILSNLSFGVQAESFERALKNLGDMLGFASQRPDKEIRKGPDNLWCIGINSYIMFECKSEVKEDRNFIKKTEAGQMEEHCAWFEAEYGDANIKPILIFPTQKLADEAYFSHDIQIMTNNELSSLKTAVKNFFLEFKEYSFTSLTESTINDFLNTNNLDVNSLLKNYAIEAQK